MTTQAPNPPQYPTTPPWATPPAEQAGPPTAEHPPMTPWGAPYTEHGQLLVPYPEELANASRAQAPPWWPVVLWTMFFGIFGTISAARRAEQARRGRNSPVPYWIAFGVTMVLGAALSAAAWVVAVPVLQDRYESGVTRLVEEQIRTDADLPRALGSDATAVVCVPTGDRVDGERMYSCTLTLADGRSATLSVTSDTDGNWGTKAP